MKKNFYALLLIPLIGLAQGNNVPGCMDPSACNYNPIANIDDGSCIIGAENVFLNSITDEFGLSSEEPFIYFEQGTDVFSQGTSLFVQGTNLFTQGTSLFFYASYSVFESLAMNLLDFFNYFDDNYELFDCNDCINDNNSNGICDELEINGYGCTNSSACNYDPDATFDDGSCTLAETYYDCDGSCINDVDGDMVCDELEVLGCTDASACNYDTSATDDDESCAFAEIYYGCDGACINDVDGDGECDEVDYDDGVGIDEVSENTPALIKMIDILGREQQEHKRGALLFYIYDNGTTKKIMK